MSKEVPKSPYLAPGVKTRLERLEEAVTKAWGIPLEKLYLKKRDRKIVEPRQVIWHYRRMIWEEEPGDIIKGTVFDRTTVSHACKTVEILYKTNKIFREKYYAFLAEFKE